MCRLTLLLSTVLLLATGVGWAAAEERITEFRSDIEIRADGAIEVTETIAVTAAGDKIKRGIFRDIPTTYADNYGNRVVVDLRVDAVTRDGRGEPFRVESTGSGVRIYIGDKNVFLQPGAYTYAITYTAPRQVGFFDDFDEIYWNVTGNDWAFPIDEASAVVTLPQGAPVVSRAAYTGRRGERGSAFTYDVDMRGRPRFAATRVLQPGEGLTVAVAWPKGFVAAPTFADDARYLLNANPGFAAIAAGLVILFVYYLVAWLRVGRDPAAGTIVPLFAPPDGLSPPAARYVMRMGFDAKAFTAAIINMAVKGYLEIHDDGGGDFSLRREAPNSDALSAGERAMARKLFGGGKEVALEKENRTRIKSARDRLSTYLKANFQKDVFVANAAYLLPGLAITVAAGVLAIVTARDPMGAGFMMLWLTLWTFGTSSLVIFAVVTLRHSIPQGLFMAGVSVMFLVGEVFGMSALADSASWPTAIGYVTLIVLSAVFFYLLKAPTGAGRRLMDRIEGFKLYLSVAEKERFATLNPPDRTPELFERYLPYAIALDVEHEWSAQFSTVLEQAMREDSYQPHWYHGGTGRGFDPMTVANRLGGSFTSAVATASSPSSSSGSGGGGSSGGGGGGGGGGGW